MTAKNKAHMTTAGICLAVAVGVVWSANNVDAVKKQIGKQGFFSRLFG